MRIQSAAPIWPQRIDLAVRNIATVQAASHSSTSTAKPVQAVDAAATDGVVRRVPGHILDIRA